MRKNVSNRFNTIIKKLLTKSINLNIFRLHDFPSDMDRIKAKQLGRWSTRLFICLYIIGIIILALYTIVQPRIVTKTFSKSSYNTYLQLKQQYNNRLECTCSSISSNYAKFVRIEPIFHPVKGYKFLFS